MARGLLIYYLDFVHYIFFCMFVLLKLELVSFQFTSKIPEVLMEYTYYLFFYTISIPSWQWVERKMDPETVELSFS